MKYEGWNVGSIIRQLSIDLLYALVTELDTDANTILAIQNKQGNISVDEELRKLSPEMRTYFSQQFVQMIKEIPN